MPTVLRRGAAFALLTLALHCAPVAAQQPAPGTGPQGSGKSPGNTEWAIDGSDARVKAAAQGKFVYYEFENPGCGHCGRMQSLLYPAFDFEALLVGMVPVKLQLESPEGQQIAKRYGITDVPSVLITTPEGRLVFLVQGFQDAPDFYRHVHKDLDRYRQFVKRLEGQEVAALSAEEAYATGRELFARSDPRAALPRLQRAATAPSQRPGLRESALEGLAAVELELGQTAESRKSIDQLIRTTKNVEQRERAELFRAQIPLAENKPAEALVLYRKFEKDHPNSAHLERVRSFIARLEQDATKK